MQCHPLADSLVCSQLSCVVTHSKQRHTCIPSVSRVCPCSVGTSIPPSQSTRYNEPGKRPLLFVAGCMLLCCLGASSLWVNRAELNIACPVAGGAHSLCAPGRYDIVATAVPSVGHVVADQSCCVHRCPVTARPLRSCLAKMSTACHQPPPASTC